MQRLWMDFIIVLFAIRKTKGWKGSGEGWREDDDFERFNQRIFRIAEGFLPALQSIWKIINLGEGSSLGLKKKLE